MSYYTDTLGHEDIATLLTNAFSKIERLKQKREEFLRLTHGRFNLFTTLLKIDDEVRLHSRYLTHLLNPQGSHDCNDLFLKSFLNRLELTKELKSEDCILVSNEHYTDRLGNIDIYIEFSEATLVIENKIHAEDQEKQLERYYDYSAKRKGRKIYLFYLTLDGDDPSKQSTGRLRKKDSVEKLTKDDFCCISYKDHVIDWIKQCIKETDSSINVNQALRQYKSTVEQLLGDTLESQDMKKIKDLLKDNPLIIQNLDAIQKVLGEIRSDRENKVRAKCLEILRRKEDRIDSWGDKSGTAFKFFFEIESNPRKSADLTILMKPDDTYDLIVYDIECGELKTVIGGNNWETEGTYLCKTCFEGKDLDYIVSEMKSIIDRIDKG